MPRTTNLIPALLAASVVVRGHAARRRLGSALAVGDLNGDGHADLAAGSTLSSSPGNAVHLLDGGTRP